MQDQSEDTEIIQNKDWKLENLLEENQSADSIEVIREDPEKNLDKDETLESPPPEFMTKQKSFLIKPTKSSMVRLSQIRDSGLFARIFHPMKEGSLRGVTIMFIRMTLGVGILTLPYYMKMYGGLLGTFILIFAALVNYWTYAILTEIGNETKVPDMIILTKMYCNTWIQKLFKVTLLVDYVSMVVFYMIMIYNVIMYLIGQLDLVPDSWYENKQLLEFRQYSPPLIVIRCCYCLGIILFLLPFIFRETLGALQKISNYSLMILCILVLYIIIEMGFFRKNLQKNEDFHVDYLSAPPKITWLECFFGVMLSYYSQTYFYSLRSELMHPTTRRLKKVSRLSMGYMFALFFALSTICYFCLGDTMTPELIVLRVPYQGKSKWSEYIFIGLVIIFLLSSLANLPLYNIPVRDFMFAELKFKRNRKNFILISIFSFVLGGVITIAYPSIIGAWNLFSITIYNFNGYMIPFLLMIYHKKRQKLTAKRYIVALVFCVISLVGMIIYNIFQLVKSSNKV